MLLEQSRVRPGGWGQAQGGIAVQVSTTYYMPAARVEGQSTRTRWREHCGGTAMRSWWGSQSRERGRVSYVATEPDGRGRCPLGQGKATAVKGKGERERERERRPE